METTKKPKRLPPHVVAYRRKGNTRVQYRGRFRVEGRQITTPLRDNPEDAYDDCRARMKEVEAMGSSSCITLGRAFALLIEDSIRREAEDITLKAYATVQKRLLRRWREDMPLNLLTVEELQEFVTDAKRERTAATIRQKDLTTIARLFKLAKLPSPVPEVIDSMGKALAVEDGEHKMFDSFKDTLAAIERVRTGDVVWGAGTRRTPDLSGREWDAALLGVTFWTAGRAGEIGRLKVSDFNLTPGQESVRLDSHKSVSRELPLFRPESIGAAKLLVAQAQLDGHIVSGDTNEKRMEQVTARAFVWKNRLKERRLNCRALRTSFCTFGQSELNIPPAVMMLFMGHKDMRTTSIYTNVKPVAHREFLRERADALLGSSR